MALLLVTVTLSMMTTPLLMKLVDKLLSRRLNPADDEDETPWVEDDKPQVIVVGFGRFGQILARERGRVEAHELLQAGVKHFSRETFSSALELGRKALVSLGMHPHQAQRAQMHFRRLDMRMLRELMPVHSDTAQISRVREARRELEEIFQREMQQERRQLDGWDEFE